MHVANAGIHSLKLNALSVQCAIDMAMNFVCHFFLFQFALWMQNYITFIREKPIILSFQIGQ